MTKVTKRTGLSLALATVILCALPIDRASATEPTTSPASDQYAAKIADDKAAAANLGDEYVRLDFDAKAQPEETVLGDDLDMAKKFYDDLAARYEKAADAWAAGDEASAKKIEKELQADSAQTSIWRVRITQYRRNQATAAPTEQWYNDSAALTEAGARPALDKILADKKTASAAWAAAAQAAVPGVDPAKLDDLTEKAALASAEVEISTWRWTWANQLEKAWPDRTVTNPDIQARLAALQKTQDNAAAIQRQRVLLNQRTQQAFRQIRRSENELFQAIRAARDAQAQSPTTQATMP